MYQLLGLEGTYRIHLSANITLQNLEVLGHRKVEVEWGMGTPTHFSFLLR